MAYQVNTFVPMNKIWTMPSQVNEAFTCLKENSFQIKCLSQELDLGLLFHILRDVKQFVRSTLFMGPFTAVVDFVPLGPATKQDIHQLLHYNNVVATNQEDQHILLEVDLAANWQSEYILADYAWTLITRFHWDTFDLDDFLPNEEWYNPPS